MNVFARFDEIPSMTLQSKLLTKQNVTDGRMVGRSDNMKSIYPPQTQFAGGIIKDTSSYNCIIPPRQQIVNFIARPYFPAFVRKSSHVALCHVTQLTNRNGRRKWRS